MYNFARHKVLYYFLLARYRDLQYPIVSAQQDHANHCIWMVLHLYHSWLCLVSLYLDSVLVLFISLILRRSAAVLWASIKYSCYERRDRTIAVTFVVSSGSIVTVLVIYGCMRDYFNRISPLLPFPFLLWTSLSHLIGEDAGKLT